MKANFDHGCKRGLEDEAAEEEGHRIVTSQGALGKAAPPLSLRLDKGGGSTHHPSFRFSSHLRLHFWVWESLFCEARCPHERNFLPSVRGSLIGEGMSQYPVKSHFLDVIQNTPQKSITVP